MTALQRYFALLLACCLIVPASLHAAPKSELWSYWATHNPGSTETVNHSALDLFLLKYVYPVEDGSLRFAYESVHAVDRGVLGNYIDRLGAVAITHLNRDEQKAFWINLYNALTIQVVLDYSPIDSILGIDISPGFFSNGPWGKTLIEIEGKQISLDDIEHRILRPIWKDPRIHYAVNCASIGCPDIWWRAASAETVEDYLEISARTFINHPRGARLQDGKLIVSSIYDWFEEDFGGSEEGVIQHLRAYADPDLAAAILGVTSIGSYDHDWALNSVVPSIMDKLRKRGS